MTKQETIDLLKQQMPGFYSVEQVIDMISKIEDSKPRTDCLDEVIDELCSKMTNMLNRKSSDDLVDLSSAELELNYDNRIELSSVEVNIDYIATDILESVASDVLHKYFFDPKTDDEVSEDQD